MSPWIRTISTTRSPHPRTQAGFTLLEVMCAFAILAFVTGMVGRIWTVNMKKAQRAVSKRELREVADSCFRRILYEIDKHDDGKTANVADFYARDWLKLEGKEAEKYRFYALQLKKKVKSAAGEADDDDAEPMFGEADTSGSESSSESESEDAGPNINLYEVELTIHYADESPDKALVVLKTYIRKPEGIE